MKRILPNLENAGGSSGSLDIVFSRDDPAALDAMTISACFADTTLNRAAARAHFQPVWTFGHGTFKEKGWDVRHFFPNTKVKASYAVTVAFEGLLGRLPNGPNAVAVSRTVDIPPSARTSRKLVWLEVVRTSLLMVISAVALQKTASAALANTNLISVAVAVFSTGFVIDSVKGGIDAIRNRV